MKNKLIINLRIKKYFTRNFYSIRQSIFNGMFLQTQKSTRSLHHHKINYKFMINYKFSPLDKINQIRPLFNRIDQKSFYIQQGLLEAPSSNRISQKSPTSNRINQKSPPFNIIDYRSSTSNMIDQKSLSSNRTNQNSPTSHSID